MGRGQLDVAKNNFDAAINVDPDNSTLYLEAGMLALQRNESEDAEYLLSRVVQRDDANTAAHFAIGELLSGQGRAEPALAHFVAVLRAKPEHIQALHHVAEACSKSVDLAEAIRLCQEGLGLAPENFELQAQMGKYYLDLGDFVSARHHTARAFELRPDDVGTLLSHAQTLLWTGEPK